MSEYQQWLATIQVQATQHVVADLKPRDRGYLVYADGRRVPTPEHAEYLKSVRDSSRIPVRVAIVRALS